MGLYIFSRLVLASWVRAVSAKSIACAREVGIVIRRMYARGRSLMSRRCVREHDSCKIARRVLTSGYSGPVYNAPRVYPAFLHTHRGVCAGVCGRAVLCKIARRVFTSGNSGAVYSVSRDCGSVCVCAVCGMW